MLDAAADLLTPEGAWTQGALYRDAHGNPAGATEGEPVCWCAVGALLHFGCYTENVYLLAETSLPESGPGNPLRPLSAFNDAPERTQSEVVQKLREAAALAREQGK